MQPVPWNRDPSSHSLVKLRTPLAQSIEKGLDRLYSMQRPAGCWEAEVVWCPMLSAQYVMVGYIMKKPLDAARKEAILRYFELWQREDGSFGLHAESHGYLFVTTLVYVAMRMMGLELDDPMVGRAKEYIDQQGGVLKIPSWGKAWLALVNLYEWEGVQPIVPELWLLPDDHFAHPRRFYCHTRLIYLPIGVLYGLRYRAPMTELLHQLRAELYPRPYASISFSRARGKLAKNDMFAWPSIPVKAGYYLSRLVDRLSPEVTRSRAIAHCSDHIRYHLQTSRFASISPVNGLLNCLALYAQDPQDPDAELAFEGADYWIWRDEPEGIRFNGARSQSWDSAFAVQAIAAATSGPEAPSLPKELRQAAARYFREHQMREELPAHERSQYYRDPLLGGFCFSDRHHRWPVSDCTGEALAAMELLLRAGESFEEERFIDAAHFVLSRQNKDGGWGSYERNRGNLLLEQLNPSELFGNCMVEHSYVECTASCIRGLVHARKALPLLPDTLREGIAEAIRKGVRFLRKSQRRDGSWAGFWGVNFTYGTMFGIQGLIDAGLPTNSPCILKARRWLLNHQLPDGGWGERWESCVQERYLPSERSQVIMTAWALMGLMAAGERRNEVLEPGIALLQRRQLPSGDWPKEGVGGVFFNTAMHHYMMYKNYFPLWALGMYQSLGLEGHAVNSPA